MKTPDEIKIALNYCKGMACGTIKLDCPYNGIYNCHDVVLEDAIVLIYQLEKQNRTLAEIKESYEKVISSQERENAAMLDTIKRMAHCGGVCIGCVHMDDEPTIIEQCEDLDFDCEKCPSPCACHSCKEGSNYTWRGVGNNQQTT